MEEQSKIIANLEKEVRELTIQQVQSNLSAVSPRKMEHNLSAGDLRKNYRDAIRDEKEIHIDIKLSTGDSVTILQKENEILQAELSRQKIEACLPQFLDQIRPFLFCQLGFTLSPPPYYFTYSKITEHSDFSNIIL